MNYHLYNDRERTQSLIPQLSAPFNELEWKLDGFPKWYRNKIRKWKREVFWSSGPRPFSKKEHEYVMDTRAHFVPDAFFIEEESNTVALLEIVETNDIKEYKASCISAVAWELDEIDWNMIVVLYYPKQQRMMINSNLLELGPIAEVKFASEKQPYVASFRSQLKVA